MYRQIVFGNLLVSPRCFSREVKFFQITLQHCTNLCTFNKGVYSGCARCASHTSWNWTRCDIF